jgi:hypothetical protein
MPVAPVSPSRTSWRARFGWSVKRASRSRRWRVTASTIATSVIRAELWLPVVQTGRTIVLPDEFMIDCGGVNAFGRIYGTVFSNKFQPSR